MQWGAPICCNGLLAGLRCDKMLFVSGGTDLIPVGRNNTPYHPGSRKEVAEMRRTEIQSFAEELADIMRQGERTPPVYSERACRYCGGLTVEGLALPLHARKGGGLQGAPSRRFWCDDCEKVTS